MWVEEVLFRCYFNWDNTTKSRSEFTVLSKLVKEFLQQTKSWKRWNWAWARRHHLPQHSRNLQDSSLRETEVSAPPHLTLVATTSRFTCPDAHLPGRQLPCSQSINRFPTYQLRPAALHLDRMPALPARTTPVNEPLLSHRLPATEPRPALTLSAPRHKAHLQPQSLSRDPVTRTERMDLGGMCCSTTLSSVALGKSLNLCNKPQFLPLYTKSEVPAFQTTVSKKWGEALFFLCVSYQTALFSEASLRCPRQTPPLCVRTCYNDHPVEVVTVCRSDLRKLGPLRASTLTFHLCVPRKGANKGMCQTPSPAPSTQNVPVFFSLLIWYFNMLSGIGIVVCLSYVFHCIFLSFTAF